MLRMAPDRLLFAACERPSCIVSASPARPRHVDAGHRGRSMAQARRSAPASL